MKISGTSAVNRVFWIILDGVGAGELPDAASYNDTGANTLGNLAKAYQTQTGRPLHLPNLESMGLGNLTTIPGVRPQAAGEGIGAYGKAVELSNGKDTTSGHWD
ncbi:MAG: hypothetical protein ABIQ95_08380, partial [Bdellovibrionia bacterium]